MQPAGTGAATGTSQVGIFTPVQPIRVGDFTIEGNSAVRNVDTTDGSNQSFKLTIPLPHHLVSPTVDINAIKNFLKPFDGEFCTKGANMCAKMKLGEEQGEKTLKSVSLSVQINGGKRHVDNITKGFRDTGKQEKVLNADDEANKYEKYLQTNKPATPEKIAKWTATLTFLGRQIPQRTPPAPDQKPPLSNPPALGASSPVAQGPQVPPGPIQPMQPLNPIPSNPILTNQNAARKLAESCDQVIQKLVSDNLQMGVHNYLNDFKKVLSNYSEDNDLSRSVTFANSEIPIREVFGGFIKSESLVSLRNDVSRNLINSKDTDAFDAINKLINEFESVAKNALELEQMASPKPPQPHQPTPASPPPNQQPPHASPQQVANKPQNPNLQLPGQLTPNQQLSPQPAVSPASPKPDIPQRTPDAKPKAQVTPGANPKAQVTPDTDKFLRTPPSAPNKLRDDK